MEISNLQKKKIIEYLNKGNRFDGRKPDEYRKIEVKTGISNKAEGSCSVKFGETEVYCGVKLDTQEPYPDSQDQGTLMTTCELSPIASPDFETGPPSIRAIELGRIIDRGVRESGFIDFKKLCIKEGERVWNVFLDIYAVNDAGNLLDVAGLAALIALGTAKMPVYNAKEGKVEYGNFSKDGLPLNKDVMAFNMTLYKIGDKIIIDPTREEEVVADARLSIGVSSDKGEPSINSLQKGQESGFSGEDMENILNLVESKWKEIFPEISKHVWGK